MDLNKFASGTYAAKWKNWGVNLLQRRQIPHLPRYLHSLLFGMQMWHLPSLPHIYSTVLHFCDTFARRKFVQIHFFVQWETPPPHGVDVGIWIRTTFGGRRASAVIAAPSMFMKRVKEASKSIVGLQYGTRSLVTSFPRSTEAFCHVISYTNHETKLQATSLSKDFEMRSKDCVS